VSFGDVMKARTITKKKARQKRKAIDFTQEGRGKGTRTSKTGFFWGGKGRRDAPGTAKVIEVTNTPGRREGGTTGLLPASNERRGKFVTP